MSKISTLSYVNFVSRFMANMRLWPKSGHILVAVSGGADSMALLSILNQIKNEQKNFSLSAVHVNHNTRGQENILEQRLVEDYCIQNNIPLKIENFKTESSSNFEMRARSFRYECFKRSCGLQDYIATAHHIDDSFEWHLMQKFKSTGLKNQIGIPVINGQIIRPLMCLTKKQIMEYLKLSQTPYLNDSSNHSLDYERNRMRSLIVNPILSEYKMALKRYIHWASLEARRFKLLRNYTQANYKVFRDDFGGIYLIHAELKNDFSGLGPVIEKILFKLSKVKRGHNALQIKKLIAAALNFKSGPMMFSGGVYSYIGRGEIYFSCEKLEILKASPIPKLDINKIDPILIKKKYPYPQFVFNNKDQLELLNKVLLRNRYNF